MVLEAIVIDNSKFFKKGTITVRVANFYYGNLTWNLVDDFPNSITDNKIEGNDEETLDMEALVSSSLGGGKNYGVFYLPQINEKGLVTTINGNIKKLLWLGSFYEPKRDDKYKITGVNIPSDKLEAEGENQDGAIDGANNLDAESDEEALQKNIIIRTKSTSFDEGDADKLDWEKVSTSNIISIGQKDITFRHFADEDGWDDTTPQKYQEIILSKKNDDEENSILFNVQNDADSINSYIDIRENKINFTNISDDGELSIIISGEDKNIVLSDYNDNTITISEDSIEINAGKKVIIKGSDKVILQDDEGGAVRIKELKSLMGKWEGHGHICPSGPTVGPPTDGTPAPLPPQLISDKQNLESKDVGLK